MKVTLQLIFFIFYTLSNASNAETGEKIEVGTFTQNEMSNWQEKSFKNHTTYQLTGNENTKVLQATCMQEASALYRRISIDLTKTPILHWSWRVNGVHTNLKDKTKAGDDYAARVYVVSADNSLLYWKAKAVNYVWANSQPAGAVWPSAFTNKAIMLAVQSGQPSNPDQWINESRNVQKDFKNLFGKDIRRVHTIAVMTDCDNSKKPSAGYYRDIWFSAN